jgi:hypothetical protein
MVRQSPPDELDERPRPIVAIRPRWPRLLLFMSPAVPMIIIVLGVWLRFHGGRPGGTGLIAGIRIFWPTATALVVFIVIALIRLRTPEFMVLEEGIKIPVNRIQPGRWISGYGSRGFYAWSEVGYCRWLPSRPGVLAIHLNAAGPVPPMIDLYRVPVRHRAGVESAIRACGKWSD